MIVYVSGVLSQGSYSTFVCRDNYNPLASGGSTLPPASYSFGAILSSPVLSASQEL